jgi:hypothetical protein
MNDRVSALIVFDDGSGPALIAAGRFTSAGSVAVKPGHPRESCVTSPVGVFFPMVTNVSYARLGKAGINAAKGAGDRQQPLTLHDSRPFLVGPTLRIDPPCPHPGYHQASSPAVIAGL